MNKTVNKSVFVRDEFGNPLDLSNRLFGLDDVEETTATEDTTEGVGAVVIDNTSDTITDDLDSFIFGDIIPDVKEPEVIGVTDIKNTKLLIQEQQQLQKQEQQNKIDKLIEETTPKKGVITKETWDVPIPSHKNIMMSDLDYQFLGAVLLRSNYGGKLMNGDNQRFIYKNKLWALDDEENIPVIAKDLKMSLSTFKRKIKTLLNTELGIVEISNNSDGEIFYKLKYATDNKYYVTINNEMLERLVTSTNSNMIKIYVLMKYNLTKPIMAEDGSYKGLKYIRKQMTYDYMLEQIGYSTKLNRAKVKTMLEDLALLGYIQIYEIDTPIRKVDKATNKEVILTVKGYEYKLNTYEEWKEHIKTAYRKEKKEKKTTGRA